jgi:hypothetical protein
VGRWTGFTSRARAGYSGEMVIERGWMVCRREKGDSIGGGAVGTQDSRITEAAPLESIEAANARCRKKGPVEESATTGNQDGNRTED